MYFHERLYHNARRSGKKNGETMGHHWKPWSIHSDHKKLSELIENHCFFDCNKSLCLVFACNQSLWPFLGCNKSLYPFFGRNKRLYPFFGNNKRLYPFFGHNKRLYPFFGRNKRLYPFFGRNKRLYPFLGWWPLIWLKCRRLMMFYPVATKRPTT